MTPPRTIAAQRTGAGIATGAAALLVVAIIGACFGWERLLSYPVLLLEITGLLYLFIAVGQRRCRVELDNEELRVTGGLRRHERRYRWDEMLEVGWHTPPAGRFTRLAASIWPRPAAGCGVLVRPKGGRFDVPGPNSPMQIATLAIFGAAAEQAACDVLRTECERHGVPFSDRGLLMMNDAPPGSPLRDPRRP